MDFVSSFEKDQKAIQKDLMLLAIYSGMAYSEIYNLCPEERNALSEALQYKAEQEEKAMKEASSKRR